MCEKMCERMCENLTPTLTLTLECAKGGGLEGGRGRKSSSGSRGKTQARGLGDWARSWRFFVNECYIHFDVLEEKISKTAENTTIKVGCVVSGGGAGATQNTSLFSGVSQV